MAGFRTVRAEHWLSYLSQRAQQGNAQWRGAIPDRGLDMRSRLFSVGHVLATSWRSQVYNTYATVLDIGTTIIGRLRGRVSKVTHCYSSSVIHALKVQASVC